VFRHRVIALTCVACFCVRGFGQEPPKADAPAERLPLKVMQAWENAEKKVRKNREIYDGANAKVLELFQKEIEKIRPAVDVAVIVKQFQQEAIVALDANAKPPAPPPPDDKDTLRAPNGHRYKFIRESLSWEDAQKKCIDMGGHLLTLETRAEHEFITQWIKAGFAVNKDQFGGGASAWMGGRELEVKPGQRQWHWVSGEPVTFTSWRGHHPHRVEADRDFLTFAFAQCDWVNFWGNQHPDVFFICEWDK
jgi:hypothetical protein